MRCYAAKSEHRTLGGVPCTVAKPDFDAPLLFYYHGWSSSPDEQGLRLMTLAGAGYTVIAPCADLHGERGKVDYDKPEVIAEVFFRAIRTHLAEFDALKAAARKLIPTGPTFLYGNSMGGMTAYHILEREDFTAAVITNSTPFTRKWADYAEAEFLEGFLMESVLDDAPFPTRTPLYAMGGDADPVVPQKEVREALEPEDRYLNFPDLAHYVTAVMMNQTVDFFDKHLKGGCHE